MNNVICETCGKEVSGSRACWNINHPEDSRSRVFETEQEVVEFENQNPDWASDMHPAPVCIQCLLKDLNK